MSSTRVRFCCAASSLSSAARRRLLYFVTPGGFFDQLPAIGRARAEDLADLSLLDDGVGLDAEAGVHQQVLHVAQAADLAVDQVFALAGSVQPPHQLDVADDQRRLLRATATASPAEARSPTRRRPSRADDQRLDLARPAVAGDSRGRRRTAAAALRPPRSACARRCRRRSRPPCDRRAGSWRSARRAPRSARRRRCSCRTRWGRRWP